MLAQEAERGQPRGPELWLWTMASASQGSFHDTGDSWHQEMQAWAVLGGVLAHGI